MIYVENRNADIKYPFKSPPQKSHKRENFLITQMIIKGRLIDDHIHSHQDWSSKTKQMYNGCYGGRPSWRDAYDNIENAYDDLISDYVPKWFIARNLLFITENCIWKRTRQYREKPLTFYIDGNERGRPLMGIDETRIVTSIEIDEQKTEVSENPIYYYMKKESYKEKLHKVNSNEIIKFWTSPLYRRWTHVRDRFLSIYGVDCKVCNTNKKALPICSDLEDRYVTKVCQSCLKGICLLSTNLKDYELEKLK